MSYTTDTTTTNNANTYLATVAVNFSAAPTSAETVTVQITSRNGTNYDLLLASAVTVASTTTKLSFIVASTIPVNNTDQVKVTCTNNSSNATVYVNIVLDPVQRSGVGVSVFRDGVLISSSESFSAYRTLQDEGTDLARRTTLDFVGSGVAVTDSGTKTTATINAGLTQAYATVDDEGTPLTQRSVINFIGSPVDCVDDPVGLETDCTFTAASGSGVNVVEAEVDFGTIESYAEVVITGQAWVLTSSDISCGCAGRASSDGSHDEGDCALMNITATVHTRVAGTGFTIGAVAQNDYASGKVFILCTGVA